MRKETGSKASALEAGDRDHAGGRDRVGIRPEHRQVIDGCLSHAGDLLTGADALLQTGLPHLAYHFATLALEEVGKADLVGMSAFEGNQAEEPGWLGKQAEDHVRKLFVALWGPSFGHEVITGDQLNAFRGLAQHIHETRLKGLYAPHRAEDLILPKDAVGSEQAQELLALARSRVEMAKLREPRALPESERALLSWFLQATEDPEKRQMILGHPSMEKLVELGRVDTWVSWLKDGFDRAEAGARALGESELRRQPPAEGERGQAKWELQVRFYSSSHSIRPKTLNWWNQVATNIKLRPAGDKKDQMLASFTLFSTVPIQSLWWAGWTLARRFAVALNIGTRGFFWWSLPEQVSRFYEKITDLECGGELVVERSPILRINWGYGALSEQDLRNTALCFGLLPYPGPESMQEPFDRYLSGLGFLSKTDVHIQFEPNAYYEFYSALKSGMRAYGDWSGMSPFEEAYDVAIGEIMPDRGARQKYLSLGERLRADPSVASAITLTEVGMMKLLCDAYFLKTLTRLAEQRRAQGGS